MNGDASEDPCGVCNGATEFIAGAASWAFLGASARRSVGPLHLVDGEGALRRLLLVTSAPVDLNVAQGHISNIGPIEQVWHICLLPRVDGLLVHHVATRETLAGSCLKGSVNSG